MPGVAGIGILVIRPTFDEIVFLRFKKSWIVAIENIKLLEKLDYNKQLTFAYLACERLYPNYISFSASYNFGEPQIIRQAIDFIYDNLLVTEFADAERINFYLNVVDIHTPFPHNFDTIFASSALDACTAILETLEFMMDRKTARLSDISTFATDTVDMYISSRDDMDFNTDKYFEQKILADPLMQREINVQNGIVDYLARIDKIELADIHNLLELQLNDSKSNINLP